VFTYTNRLDELDPGFDRAAQRARCRDLLQPAQLFRREVATEVDGDLEPPWSMATVISPRAQPFVRAYIASVVDIHAASAAGKTSCGAGPLPSLPRRSGSSVSRRCLPSIKTSCRSVPGIERAVAVKLIGLVTASPGSRLRESGPARSRLRTTTRRSGPQFDSASAEGAHWVRLVRSAFPVQMGGARRCRLQDCGSVSPVEPQLGC